MIFITNALTIWKGRRSNPTIHPEPEFDWLGAPDGHPSMLCPSPLPLFCIH